MSAQNENSEIERESKNQLFKGFPQKFEKIAMYSAMSSLLFLSSFGNLFNPIGNANAADLKAELKQLSNQVLLQEKLLQASKTDKKVPSFNNLPDGTKITGKEVKDSIARIRVLQAYLDEVERDIFNKEWKYVPGFIGVFGEQEEAFVKLIEGLYPTTSVSDRSSREALSYEAKKMFIELDNLREAAKYKRTNLAQKSYVNIALSYDRFLKAGDLYTAYDPITSTEPFFANIEKKLAMPKDPTNSEKNEKVAKSTQAPVATEAKKNTKVAATTTASSTTTTTTTADKEKKAEKKVESNTKATQAVAGNKNTEKKAVESEKKDKASTTTASTTSTVNPSSNVKVASEKVNNSPVSTSKAANDKPVSVIKFDEKSTPQVPDLIVVIGGPDKGKTGKLIGITEEKGVIKLDSNGKFSEVKIINMNQIGKQSK